MKDFDLSPIAAKDLALHKPVPWPIYDEFGKLLLSKGSVIRTERQLEILLRVGLYANEITDSNENDGKLKPIIFDRPVNPFAEFEDLCLRLSELFQYIEKKDNPPEQAVYNRTMSIVNYIQGLVIHDTDAMIGAIHLMDQLPYHILHPMQSAVLCQIMASRLKMDQEKCLSLLAAALTANIAMNAYQVKLHQQRKPLTEQQRSVIEKHPEVGASMLARAGVTDKNWLRLVRTHHERPDGSGYPRGLSAESLALESHILALADIYSAMIMPRPYRESVGYRETLKELFTQRGRVVDEKLTALFIHELGLYPPGVCVRLKNGELAIVVGRTSNSKEPLVASVRKPDGNIFLNPRRRNTGVEEFSICGVCPPSEKIPVNPAILWGIQALQVQKKRVV